MAGLPLGTPSAGLLATSTLSDKVRSAPISERSLLIRRKSKSLLRTWRAISSIKLRAVEGGLDETPKSDSLGNSDSSTSRGYLFRRLHASAATFWASVSVEHMLTSSGPPMRKKCDYHLDEEGVWPQVVSPGSFRSSLELLLA
jgi:hypothetical protein